MRMLLFFMFVLGSFFYNSCTNKGDPPEICKNFVFRVVFIDSVKNIDVTGDTLNFDVKYLKDSIYYEVVSTNININFTKPTIDNNISNIYSTYPIDLSAISNNEQILLIFKLNEFTQDTSIININNKIEFSIINKNRIISNFINFNCEKLIYVKR